MVSTDKANSINNNIKDPTVKPLKNKMGNIDVDDG